MVGLSRNSIVVLCGHGLTVSRHRLVSVRRLTNLDLGHRDDSVGIGVMIVVVRRGMTHFLFVTLSAPLDNHHAQSDEENAANYSADEPPPPLVGVAAAATYIVVAVKRATALRGGVTE